MVTFSLNFISWEYFDVFDLFLFLNKKSKETFFLFSEHNDTNTTSWWCNSVTQNTIQQQCTDILICMNVCMHVCMYDYTKIEWEVKWGGFTVKLNGHEVVKYVKGLWRLDIGVQRVIVITMWMLAVSFVGGCVVSSM